METAEVGKKISELKLELMKERGHVAVSGAVTNPGRIREIRKTIARLLTKRNAKTRKQ